MTDTTAPARQVLDLALDTIQTAVTAIADGVMSWGHIGSQMEAVRHLLEAHRHLAPTTARIGDRHDARIIELLDWNADDDTWQVNSDVIRAVRGDRGVATRLVSAGR